MFVPLFGLHGTHTQWLPPPMQSPPRSQHKGNKAGLENSSNASKKPRSWKPSTWCLILMLFSSKTSTSFYNAEHFTGHSVSTAEGDLGLTSPETIPSLLCYEIPAAAYDEHDIWITYLSCCHSWSQTRRFLNNLICKSIDCGMRKNHGVKH